MVRIEELGPRGSWGRVLWSVRDMGAGYGPEGSGRGRGGGSGGGIGTKDRVAIPGSLCTHKQSEKHSLIASFGMRLVNMTTLFFFRRSKEIYPGYSTNNDGGHKQFRKCGVSKN